MDRLLDFLLNFYGPAPYFVLFGILFLCGLGLPIPEDITLFAGGMLAYYGVTELVPTIVICFLGVMTGDSVIFLLGARYGRRLITNHPFFAKLLHAERMAKVEQSFHRQGNKLIFVARFMPGLRAAVFFSAGVLKIPFRTFFFYDGIAALLSVPLLVGIVYYLGDFANTVIRTIQRAEYGIAVVIFSVIFFFLGKWYLAHRKAKREVV